MDLLVLLRRLAVIAVAAGLCSVGGACSSSREFLAKDGTNDPGFGAEDGGEEGAGEPVLLCPSAECPAGRATCPNRPFACGADLMNDEENCGACGVRCRQDTEFLRTFNAVSVCGEGMCRLVCAPGFADCNGAVEDGCETNTFDNRDNCGGCGLVCESRCLAGKCGCVGSATFCPGVGCVVLEFDDGNCRACGNACPPSKKPDPDPALHAYYGCSFGECDQLKCEPGRADCNNDLGEPGGDGCEVADILSDPKNCGTCGHDCGPGAGCWMGKCMCGCGQPCFKELNTDVDNCGVCGYTCPGDSRSLRLSESSLGVADPSHGKPVCEQGACEYVCSKNWDDCDTDTSNGCETNLLIDPHNCGACGVRCDGVEGQACVNGKCLMKECPPTDPGQTL